MFFFLFLVQKKMFVVRQGVRPRIPRALKKKQFWDKNTNCFSDLFFINWHSFSLVYTAFQIALCL